MDHIKLNYGLTHCKVNPNFPSALIKAKNVNKYIFAHLKSGDALNGVPLF